MNSSTSSARRTGEEEETDHSRYRYIPRTLLQGRSFYEPAIHGLSSDSSSSNNSYGNSRRSSAKSVRRAKRDDDNELQFNNLTGQYLNVPRADLLEDISNNSDNESQVSHNNDSQLQTRNLDLRDLNIKNIHGRNHYGKLETTPNTDHQDRLWTQIDALDDVKNLASNVGLYEHFQPDFEEQLSKLRLAHSHLLKMMRDRDSLLDEERKKSKTEYNGDYVNDFDKGIGSTVNRPGGHPMTGKTETNGSSNLIAASSIPTANPSADRDTGGAVSNSNADANSKATSALKSNRRMIPSSIPSRIQTDEDRYVQDIVGIIKQLRI